MRIPIVAGNWKMNKTIAEAIELAQAMRQPLSSIRGVERVVCPPFVCLSAVKQVIAGTDIALGAQNMHSEEKGAFTGEVAPGMLEGLCQYVIIGHSERRQYFGETDEGVSRKIRAALAHRLTPIVCVGETLALRQAGQADSWVRGQVTSALEGLTSEQIQSLVIAYEPIWAIGTGIAATAEDAQQVIGEVIRPAIAAIAGANIAQAVRIQYGGSVSPANTAELMGKPDIDGGLVGGASLKAGEFVDVVRLAAASKGLA